MNILLTGSRGFIGRAVADRLWRRGHRVFGVDVLEPRVHGDAPTGVHAADFHWGRCASAPYLFFREADVVVHLAAQVGVADSQADPRRYIDDNVVDTTDFLENLVRWSNAKRLVVASSMSVYGDPETESAIHESHQPCPASVYGLTKYAQERLVLLAAKRLGAEGVALRFFNVYGPGQALTNPYTGVLANFANWLLADQRPIVYEDGQQTRDFVYVDDVADAVAAVACAPRPFVYDVYNVSTGKAMTIEGVARYLASALDRKIDPKITGASRLGDVRHCVGSSRRLRAELADWNPRPFAEGVREYARWLTNEVVASSS